MDLVKLIVALLDVLDEGELEGVVFILFECVNDRSVIFGDRTSA
jgi:hypothetical protein